MTREVPILFSAPMIRALVDGRKSQTRRIQMSASPIERLLILSDEDHARPRTVPFATAAADRTAVR